MVKEKKMKKQEQPKQYTAKCLGCGRWISGLSPGQFSWNKKIHSLSCDKKIAKREKELAKKKEYLRSEPEKSTGTT